MAERNLVCVEPSCTCAVYEKGLLSQMMPLCKNCRHHRLLHDFVTDEEAADMRARAQTEANCRAYGCECGTFVTDTSSLLKHHACAGCNHLRHEHRVLTSEDRRRMAEESAAEGRACVMEDCTCPGYQVPVTGKTDFLRAGQCRVCGHTPQQHAPDGDPLHHARELFTYARQNVCRHEDDGRYLPPYSTSPAPPEADLVKVHAALPLTAPTDSVKGRCPCPGFKGALAQIHASLRGLPADQADEDVLNAQCRACRHPLVDHRTESAEEIAQRGKDQQLNATLVMVAQADGAVVVPAWPVPAAGAPVALLTCEEGRLAVSALAQSANILGNPPDGAAAGAKSPDDLDDGNLVDLRRIYSTTVSGTPACALCARLLAYGGANLTVDWYGRARNTESVPSPITALQLYCRHGGDVSAARRTDDDAQSDEQAGADEPRAASGDDKEESDPAASDDHDDADDSDGDGGKTAGKKRRSTKKTRDSDDEGDDSKQPPKRSRPVDDPCLLAAGHEDGTVTLWECERDEATLTMIAQNTLSRRQAVSSLSFSCNGRQLAVGGAESLVRVFNVEPAARVLSVFKDLKIGYGAVLAMTWRAQGDVIACGGQDDRIYVFSFAEAVAAAAANAPAPASSAEPKKGKPAKKKSDAKPASAITQFFRPVAARVPGEGARIFDGHSSFVSALAFNADGSLLLSAGWDGCVYIWRVALGSDPPSAPLYAFRSGLSAATSAVLRGRVLALAGRMPRGARVLVYRLPGFVPG
eukprot:m.74999 g.74999  ORF g.74999 m.74999 type:complete len:753 (-) comp7792_c0_seq1:85-2343(-)